MAGRSPTDHHHEQLCLGDIAAIGLLHPEWPRQAQTFQVSCPWSAADVQQEFQDVLVDVEASEESQCTSS